MKGIEKLFSPPVISHQFALINFISVPIDSLAHKREAKSGTETSFLSDVFFVCFDRFSRFLLQETCYFFTKI